MNQLQRIKVYEIKDRNKENRIEIGSESFGFRHYLIEDREKEVTDLIYGGIRGVDIDIRSKEEYFWEKYNAE
jgi:hypothetical protein